MLPAPGDRHLATAGTRFLPPRRCAGSSPICWRRGTPRTSSSPPSRRTRSQAISTPRFGRDLAQAAAAVLYRTTNGNPLFLATAIDHLVGTPLHHAERRALGAAVSPPALEARSPRQRRQRGNAQNLAELTQDERPRHRRRQRHRHRGLALARGARRRRRGNRPRARPRTSRAAAAVHRPRGRDRARQRTLQSALPLSATISIRRSSSIGLRRRSGPKRMRAPARPSKRSSRDANRTSVGDLACHFHGANDHAARFHYLRLAAANALKRYAPREAAALLHGAVTHAAFLPDDSRRHAQLPMMLELGKAQLAAGEADPRRRDPRPTAQARREPRAARTTTSARCWGSPTSTSERSREATLDTSTSESPTSPPASPTRSLAATAVIRSVCCRSSSRAGPTCLRIDASIAGVRCSRRSRSSPASLAIRLLFIQTTRRVQAAWTAGRRLLTASVRSGTFSDTLHCCHALAIAALHLGRWGDAMEIALEGAAIADKAGSARHGDRHAAAAGVGRSRRPALGRSAAPQPRRPASRSKATKPPTRSRCHCFSAARRPSGRGSSRSRPPTSSGCASWHRRERLVVDWFWKSQLHGALAELAMRTGDLPTAAREAQRAQEAAASTPERTWRGRAHVIAAQVAPRTGRVRRRRQAPAAGAPGNPRHRCAACLLAHRSRDRHSPGAHRPARFGPAGADKITNGPSRGSNNRWTSGISIRRSPRPPIPARSTETASRPPGPAPALRPT